VVVRCAERLVVICAWVLLAVSRAIPCIILAVSWPISRRTRAAQLLTGLKLTRAAMRVNIIATNGLASAAIATLLTWIKMFLSLY
jgi:hypothetical protein